MVEIEKLKIRGKNSFCFSSPFYESGREVSVVKFMQMWPVVRRRAAKLKLKRLSPPWKVDTLWTHRRGYFDSKTL